MPYNHTAENVLGTIGTVFWTGQIIPQIWKSWREKSTEGLSGLLMLIWATSAVFLGVYNIVQDINIPLIIQPQLFGALAALSWTQCLYYGNKISQRLCTIIFISYICVFAGFEAGMTYALRAILDSAPDSGDRLLQFFGIFSAVLIAVGLIPQYIEIWRLREVIGISMLFMSIDMLGGVFSLLSLVFRETFDVVASVTYISVIVLDGVVVICAIILNPRAKRRKARLSPLSLATTADPTTTTTTMAALSSNGDHLPSNPLKSASATPTSCSHGSAPLGHCGVADDLELGIVNQEGENVDDEKVPTDVRVMSRITVEEVHTETEGAAVAAR